MTAAVALVSSSSTASVTCLPTGSGERAQTKRIFVYEGISASLPNTSRAELRP